MIKNFQERTVFTTHNPETFLTFKWETGDSSVLLVPKVDASVEPDTFYINGIDAYEYIDPSIGLGLELNKDVSIAAFHVYTRKLNDWDHYITFPGGGSELLTGPWTDPSGNFDLIPGSGVTGNFYTIVKNAHVRSNSISASGGEELEIKLNWNLLSSSGKLNLYIIENSGIETKYPLSVGTNTLFHTIDSGTTSYQIYLNVYDFVANVEFNVSLASVKEVLGGLYLSNRPYVLSENVVNVFETANPLVDDEASYLLMRTNPKFSGNIKLVVDSSNRFYLDTFKVSDILNNKKYRRQRISGDSVFSGDVRKIFSSLPLGELYKVGAEDTLNVAVPKTDLHLQYNMTYSYGARLMQDDLYNESYSLLAPLWLNSKVPDYFVVMRVPGVFNQETYDGEDLSGLIDTYMLEGKIVKSWGMKETTPLGNYVFNHVQELLSVRSPLFLSLSDPTQRDPDPNTWYGVAVDKGIITGRSETTYFFDRQKTYTSTNAYLSEGFERHNLLCPNLLNIEFLFDDDEAPMYSMNRYFGLYLTENELFRVAYYSQDPSTSIRLLPLDDRDPSAFFSSSVFESVFGNVAQTFKDRLFTLNDIQEIKRFSNRNQINGNDESFVSKWLNKPGEQLFSTPVKEIEVDTFITLRVKALLHQGEHLRIVDKTNFKIWEVYGIDTDLIEAGNSWTYASIYESDGYPTVYRTAFSTKGIITDQLNAIKKAFEVFGQHEDVPFRVSSCNENTISFTVDNFESNEYVFQRLTAQTVNDPTVPGSPFNSAAGYGDIEFFGALTPTIEDFERISADASYGPIGFELFGDRMFIEVPFFKATGHLYSMSDENAPFFEKYLMYMAEDKWYRLIEEFNVKAQHSFIFISDPTETGKIIIMTSNSMATVEGKWNARRPYPLSIALMSINPVKDFDFVVYDDASLGFKSEYWYAREDDPSSYTFTVAAGDSRIVSSRASYKILSGTGNIFSTTDSSVYAAGFGFNTFYSNVTIEATTTTVVTYDEIDGNETYTSYVPGSSEEDIEEYFQDDFRLRYGLTIPYVTKWVGTGKDCRGNDLRLNFDPCIYVSPCNFIPTDGCFSGEITYPVFKYLDAGQRAWESYIFYDINDVITYTEGSKTKRLTFKELMFADPYVDVFSKLVYSGAQTPSTKTRSTLSYFNQYKGAIDFIINGLNVSIRLDEGARSLFNPQDWDRYKVSFISTTSKNRENIYPLEIFINQNTRTILMVWYQGVDTLNYTKRKSTYFGGKSNLHKKGNEPKSFQAFKDNDSGWGFSKAPFVVNTASPIIPTTRNVYAMETDYSTEETTPYAQLNWGFVNNEKSVFNAYELNQVISQEFTFNKQFNTFKGYVDYAYVPSPPSFGPRILNHGYIYDRNENYYQNLVTELEHLRYIISNNNIGYYIFAGDKVYDDRYFTAPPASLTINDPRQYKGIYTYNGWYRPKFNQVLNFQLNEDPLLVSALGTDFTMGNTKINGYNNIPQVWYNKVVSRVTTQDVSTGRAIDYLKEFNPMKAQWDASYYRLYSDSGVSNVDGFNSSLELPSYFGSKLVKLPNELVLDRWASTQVTVRERRERHTISFNLTRRINDMFKRNGTFLDNWAGLSVSPDVIDAYINNTILNYYNINTGKIETRVWAKPYDGTRVALQWDQSFKPHEGGTDGALVQLNNDFLYRTKVSAVPDLTYFFEFKLFKK